MGVSRTSFWWELCTMSYLHANLQIRQELKQFDQYSRRGISEWLLEFSTQIMFGDEVHFTLNVHMNIKSSRCIPKKWLSDVLSNRKASSYDLTFSKMRNGNAIAINSPQCHAITDYLLPPLDEIALNDVNFQEEDAACHIIWWERISTNCDSFQYHAI